MDQSLREKIHQEFSRPAFKNWDRQFIFIFILTLLFEAIVVVVMDRWSVEEFSQSEIDRIQEQFADFIMAEEEREAKAVLTPVSTTRDIGVEEIEATEVEEGGSPDIESAPAVADRESRTQDGTNEGRSARTEETRRQNRQAAAEARRQDREAMSRSVSSKGLLGLLTGSGSAAQGDAVDNMIGGSGSGNGINRDLDQILSSVDGLQTQGGSGLGGSGSGIGDVRGSRSGGPTSIDDLVSERTDMATASMSRQGDLVMESPSDVMGRGSKSAYRSSNAIREVLLGHVPAVRYCYERELKRDPELKGKISVRITVSADGYVTAVEVISSSLNNTRVERCILARIRLWKDFRPIDPSEGDVTFRQVYTFGM